MEQAATNCQISANNRWFQKPAKDSLVQAGIPPTLVVPWWALFRCKPMSVPGLSILGLKRIGGFVSILRSINPTITNLLYVYIMSALLLCKSKMNTSEMQNGKQYLPPFPPNTLGIMWYVFPFSKVHEFGKTFPLLVTYTEQPSP